jgi:sulfur carrier protein
LYQYALVFSGKRFFCGQRTRAAGRSCEEAHVVVVVNGKEMEIVAGMTVLALVEDMGLDPGTVVVECNRDIVPSTAFAQTALCEGDHLEVLRFVGGG